MTAQLTFEDAAVQRDIAIARVTENAGERFRREARAFVLSYLLVHGAAPGEEITDACKSAGIRPDNDDRAFGGIYYGLAKAGRIEKAGTCLRRKGHLTAGGNVWKLL